MANTIQSRKSNDLESDGLRHRDFIIDWLDRVLVERKVQKNDLDSSRQWGTDKQLNNAAWLLGIFQVTLIILYATVGGTQLLTDAAPGSVTQGYNMFIGVEIMMFIGFGYLMTFMKWYGLGAVGFTMLVTAIGLQWAVFTESFFDQLMNNLDNWHDVNLDIYSLLNALYATSAVLISFGALIGKISPFQLVIMAIVELFLHSFNFKILMGSLHIADMGGTYIDHMFGAYFGLAAAYMFGVPKSQPEMGSVPDIFSLIGTLFLWVYWPSFVGGAAVADSDQQQRALVNTVLALSSSTVIAFFASSVLSNNKRFRPVDIQNATLAGGVAIGCTANLSMSGFGAIMIGATSGLVSTIGYNHIQPYLEEHFHIHDTCGVHNLHAMPSIVGAIASVILAGYKASEGQTHDASIYGNTHEGQWWRQLVGIIVCVSFAILSGSVVGYFLRKVESDDFQKVPQFHDNQWWIVAEDYGRSLYTELGLVVKNVEMDGGGVGVTDRAAGNIERAILDWSSHNGRRRVNKNDGDIDLSIGKTQNEKYVQMLNTFDEVDDDKTNGGVKSV